MRLVVTGSVFSTIVLVVSSYSGTEMQLACVMLASLVGALLTIHIMRTPRFERLGFTPVFILAAVVQLLALLGRPILEDDYYRYLWDAYRFASDGTPYGFSPAMFFYDPAVASSFQDILNFINYPDIPTVYGPVLQLFFLAGYGIAPGSVGALQILNAVVVFATLVVLARCGAKPRWLLLYAISPLVLKEAVMTAHPDALTGLLALAAFVIGKRSSWMNGWQAGMALGFAVASKISVVILVPFLLARGGMRAVVTAALTVVACYLPFLLLSGSDAPSLLQFAQNWRFNPLFHTVLEWFFGVHAARWLAGVVIVAIVAALCWLDARQPHRPQIPAADLALGALLIFSPVANPWYLLWLLPFAVLRPTRTAWAATFILPLSYWNGANWPAPGMEPFEVHIIVTLIEITLLSVAIVVDWKRPLRS
jgi:hypothetical protein